jgi:hypothetical protein
MVDSNRYSKQCYNGKKIPGVSSGVVECQLLFNDNATIIKGAARNRPGAMVSCPLHREEY